MGSILEYWTTVPSPWGRPREVGTRREGACVHSFALWPRVGCVSSQSLSFCDSEVCVEIPHPFA